MPRISLGALVCGDTNTLSLQVTLPSYFLTNQEKSNIYKPEEHDLKGAQMGTQNLRICCLFFHILRVPGTLL